MLLVALIVVCLFFIAVGVGVLSPCCCFVVLAVVGVGDGYVRGFFWLMMVMGLVLFVLIGAGDGVGGLFAGCFRC